MSGNGSGETGLTVPEMTPAGTLTGKELLYLVQNKQDVRTTTAQLAVFIAEALQNIYLGTLSLTEPYTNQIFQRDTRTGGLFSKGTGLILLTVNPSQPVTTLEHRLRDAASPATVIQDWTNSVPPIAAGSQVVELIAPAGLYRYLVDVRANQDDTSLQSTTAPVMVGELIAFSGQSLAEDMVSTAATGDPATIASFGLTASPWGYIFAAYASNTGEFPPVPDGPDFNYPPSTFEIPRDSGGIAFKSTYSVEYMNKLIALAGVPCAMIGYSVGGSGIASWLPGYVGPNSGHWDKLVNVLTLAGGNFGTFIWDQGHYETKDGNTSANYYLQLSQLESSVDVAFPDADYSSIIATIPGIGNYGDGPPAIEMVRSTAKQYTAATALTSYVDGYDATLWVDLVHPSQAGNIPYADHFYRATANAWGLLTFGDKGPVIASANRIYGSKNIVLTVTQTNGGTAWQSVGTPANQFTVYVAGTTVSPVALDGSAPIDLSNSAQITLQLASAPTEPVSYDIWYRRPPDTTFTIASAIYDNVTEGDGLTNGRQLWDTATAVTTPLPSYPITVNTPTPTLPATGFTVTGTYSIGSPTALDYSTDSGANWTAAITPTIGGGNYSLSVPAGVPYGAFKVIVRDHNVPTNFGTSGLFTIVYTPPSLASNPGTPLLILDASAPSTLWADTGRTIPLQAGGALAAWSDTSGQGNNFQQTTSTLRPVYQTNIKNGLPGIRFTGTLAEYLTLSGGALSASLMNSNYFALVIYTPASLPAVASDVFYTGFASSGQNFIRLGEFRAAGETYHSKAGSTITNAIVNASAVANTLSKVLARYDGTTIYNQVNAITEVTTVYSGGTQANFNQALIGIYGQPNTLQFPFDGWIHEIRIYGAFGNGTNKTDAQTYATSKWGS